MSLTKEEIRRIERELEARDLLARVEGICKSYNVLIGAVIGKKTSKRVVLARDAVFHRLHTIGFSYLEIGNMLGYEHSTVIYGVRRYKERDNGRALR